MSHVLSPLGAHVQYRRSGIAQVRHTHTLLATLCRTAAARQNLRATDAVAILVAVLEKQRIAEELDIKGRIAGRIQLT